ncbi:MAG: Ornithine carbamoyltransferase 1, phaseolotoxin-sensitive [Alphaproteobacteria bacterium MarineAlpha4_Bin2]|nr:MAG: Ornithine carbamoyltransferase 1, phaseolotoxin-sensitive [Alphaproteobacteria bacterium MarineAlpha4_Bin2]
MTAPKHFLDIDQFDENTLRKQIDLGVAYKAGAATEPKPLQGKTLAMIFEKASTRTRVSFDVGMRQLGGETIVLDHTDMQLGRGETVADTARVLSRYVDAIMIRTTSPQNLIEMAENATVPVINGLTDNSHPCQIMADVMTFEEHRGPIASKIVAWCGDGNNMASSWIHAATRLGFELRLACPEQLKPDEHVVKWAYENGANIQVTKDPDVAVAGADCVMTDVWVSMGDDGISGRHNMLRPYQVDDRLMSLAKPNSIFMHCLPAHRGEEVTAGVMDGPQSVVWDEAENRLHVQKGILTWCLT